MDFKKRRRILVAFCALAIITLMLLLIACGDFGVEANFFKGTVRGEIRIDTVVPESTDEIRVALSPDFPPSDFKELQIGEVLPVNRDTTVASQRVPFEMNLPYGKYAATVVIWKEKDKSWSLTDIVGLHGNLERFELKTIELNSSHPVEDSVSIGVDLSRVNRTARVAGQITFAGEWPANTFITALIMLKDFGDLAGIPPVLVFVPIGAAEFSYDVGVSPATYTIIAVAWLPIGPFDFGKIKFLGFYENPDSPGNAGILTIDDEIGRAH